MEMVRNSNNKKTQNKSNFIQNQLRMKRMILSIIFLSNNDIVAHEGWIYPLLNESASIL